LGVAGRATPSISRDSTPEILKEINGAVVVDKPPGWTSHDVVNRVRRLANTRKVGHLGTLDPIATGVLPLLIGRSTRLARFFSKSDKKYEGIVRFGYATDTYDSQGTPVGPDIAVSLDCDQLRAAIRQFEGPISQVPPPVSAKKISGVPAYKLARKSKPVNLEPVRVEIFGIEVVDCGGNEARIRVHCSAGTYMRSIAHELGILFGCGAHLTELRRAASGIFELSEARTLEQLAEMADAGRFADAVVPAASLIPEFPSEVVDSMTAGFIRQGRDFRVSPFRVGRDARFVKAVTNEGELVAIGEAKLPNVYHPVLVL
jgi:tRNA pseudouridine55 synthase